MAGRCAMRVPRAIIRKRVMPFPIYSLNILDTATETLTESGHNIEIDTEIREYKAVDIV